MRYLVYFEFVAVALLGLVVITQILLPALRGTLLFPYFRRESKLKAQIAEANQRLHEAELEDVLKERTAPAQESPAEPVTTKENKE